MNPGVLFVSPREQDASRLSQMLASLPIAFEHVNNLQQARVRLQNEPYGVILTEADLPDGMWLELLDFARELAEIPEVIVTDPMADARFWAEAINLGAYDLISQPFYEPEVRRILSNACTRIARKEPGTEKSVRQKAAHAMI